MKPLFFLLRFGLALPVLLLSACSGSGGLPSFSGNDSVLSSSCNWTGNHSVVHWLQEPTVSQGVLSFWGRIEGPTSGTGNWSLSVPGGLYYSPFHVYGDCQPSPVVTILPPNGLWNPDPNDAVASVWDASGNTFQVVARLPSLVANYGKLELHVGDVNEDLPCEAGNCSLSIKRIRFD